MTDNQQRAAEFLTAAWWAAAISAVPGEMQGPVTDRVAAELTGMLDAAEARGRAEVAAKVEEIAHEWGRHTSPWRRAADRLRALVAEVPR